MLAEEAEAEGFGAVASKRAPPALRCGGAGRQRGPAVLLRMIKTAYAKLLQLG